MKGCGVAAAGQTLIVHMLQPLFSQSLRLTTTRFANCWRVERKSSQARSTGEADAGEATKEVTEEEIINAVRWRYRICHYLFRLGAIWILIGAVIGLFVIRYKWWGWPRDTAELIGLIGVGIFMSAFALTLAIYRCPV